MSFRDSVKAVTAAHVKMAIAEIDQHGVPPNRRSTKWCLPIGDRRYPPKYVLALAVKHAIGGALPPDAHSGGEQTNSLLRDLGFEIPPGASNV
jgi:5-methylcytosine-specific restriction protein B